MSKELTPKEKLFISEYLANGFNATKAAIRAGYSENSARQIGSENLSKPYIKQEIESVKKELLGDADNDIIENVKFWRSMRDDPETPEAARLKASEMLGKFRVMFTDKKEVEHSTINDKGEKVGIDYSKLSTEALKEIVNASKD